MVQGACATTPGAFAWLGRSAPNQPTGFTLLASASMATYAIGPLVLGQASAVDLALPFYLAAAATALGGLLVLIPYLLIQGGGYSGTAAGAALLPFPLVLGVASPVMGGVAGRLGPRLPLTVGSLVVAAVGCVGWPIRRRCGRPSRPRPGRRSRRSGMRRCSWSRR